MKRRRKNPFRKRPKKKPKPDPPPPRSFLGLPPEIRQIIYEHCLITKHIIRPFVTTYEANDGIKSYKSWPRSNKVATSLLFTNRLIYEESRRVLYSRNTFFLSGTYISHWPPAYCFQFEDTSTLWFSNKDFFRSIHVSFDYRDVDYSCRRQVMQTTRQTSRRPDYREDDTIIAHDLLLATVFQLWITKLRLIRLMRLSDLTIHLSECSCPNSCCRLEMFLLGDALLMQPWHRAASPGEEDNANRPPSLRHTFTDQNAARAWGGLVNVPADLDKMRFQVVSDERYISSDHVQQYAHELGLGCQLCPVIEGRPRPEGCNYQDAGAVQSTINT